MQPQSETDNSVSKARTRLIFDLFTSRGKCARPCILSTHYRSPATIAWGCEAVVDRQHENDSMPTDSDLIVTRFFAKTTVRFFEKIAIVGSWPNLIWHEPPLFAKINLS